MFSFFTYKLRIIFSTQMSSRNKEPDLKHRSDHRRDHSESERRRNSPRPKHSSSPRRSPPRRRSRDNARDSSHRSSRQSRSRSPVRRDQARPPERDIRNPVGESRRAPPANQPINRREAQSNPASSNQRTGRTADHAEPSWGGDRAQKKEEAKMKDDPNKEKPNFEKSGKLLEDTNLVNGVVITYAQPPEARLPKVRWRFYPFKGDEALATMYLHRQSAYLLGRDRRVADIPLDHPSCSKQHAVIQYRLIPMEKDDGTVVRRVKPYIIDLNSGNGTLVNGKKIEPQRYVELLEKDVVKFGFSSREYVMLHEGSKDDEYHSDDDDRPKSEEKD